MQTQSNARVKYLECNHPLATFILDTYNGSCIDDGWTQRTLQPALISLGKLRYGEVFKFNDLKLNVMPNQSGDEVLTLELVADQDPNPDQITQYAFESNLKNGEGKRLVFYIVAAKLGYDVGVAPKRILLDATLPHVEEVTYPSSLDHSKWLDKDSLITKAQALLNNEWVVKLPNQQHLPHHITFNPATQSYSKYKITHHEGILPSESELVMAMRVEDKLNPGNPPHGWSLEELEAIVKHLKEHENEHV